MRATESRPRACSPAAPQEGKAGSLVASVLHAPGAGAGERGAVAGQRDLGLLHAHPGKVGSGQAGRLGLLLRKGKSGMITNTCFIRREWGLVKITINYFQLSLCFLNSGPFTNSDRGLSSELSLISLKQKLLCFEWNGNFFISSLNSLICNPKRFCIILQGFGI